MKKACLKTAILLLAVGLAVTAVADTTWTGAAGDGLWKTPGNWTNGVPPAPSGTVNINYVAAAPTILIDETTAAVSNSDIHGPNWGATLNIVGGSLNSTGFVMAPVATSEATRSYINVSDGAVVNLVNLCLGDNWWFVAPYVTMNVYDEDTLITLSDWLWVGGYLNLYGGTIDVAGNMNLAANTAASGVTRLDIWEGKLIIRGADVSASVPGWIAAGFLTGYGRTPGPGSSSIVVDTTTLPGGTILTAVPSLSAREPDPQPLNDDGTVGELMMGQAEVTLNWQAGIDPNTLRALPFNPDIRKHYIYISAGGEEAEPVLSYLAAVDQGQEPTLSYGPVTLDENTIYYWSVEQGLDDGLGGVYPAGDPNNIVGPVWSFRTVAITPEIRSNPLSVIADPDAVFSVTASSTAQFFQWFKVGDPHDIPLADVGGKYSGAQTNTLTVFNATLADEGQYYCIAYYQATPSAPSAPARLWTPRLMGHWKFDGNLLDAVAETVPGALQNHGILAGTGTTEPAFAVGAGLDGGDVIEFFNDGYFVEIPNPDFFNFYTQSFTLNYWYKEAEYVGWRLPVSKLDPGSAGWLTGVDSEFRNQAVFIFETAADPAFWADGDDAVNVGTGQWVMITVTYDAADSTLRMYTNGALSEALVVEIDDAGSLSPLSIGGRIAENSIAGAMDDVRIYSYPLAPMEIADLYLAFETDKYVCVADPDNPLLFDFNNDCRITLADFAAFAGQWLECQRVPVDSCDWIE